MEPVPPEYLIPIEVWEKVFQNLETKDALNCRLVCSAWRRELDDHFDKWTVRLDQKSPDDFQDLLQLKVKEVRIVDLTTPVDLGQGGTSRLFKHPEALHKLSITRDSQICPENLLFLLNSYGRTIKHLDLVGGDVSHPSCDLHPNGLQFGNLETLNLDLGLYLNFPLPPHITLFKLMIGLSTMPKIKFLTLALVGSCIYVISSTILGFIANNGTDLEVLDCYLTPMAHDELPANPIDLALLKQVRRLRKIKIKYDVYNWTDMDGHLHINQFPSEFVAAWSTLLKGQQDLTQLHLHGLPISRRILKLVCQGNQNTLREIVLHVDYDIDLAVLAGCVHLKELCLGRREFEPTYCSLRNARSLPVGIQKFESNYYLIESEDILDFFTAQQELEEIKVSHSGSDGSNGVTAAVLAQLVINRDLSNKLRMMFIEDFNHSSAEDLAALNEICRGLEKGWTDKQDFRRGFVFIDRMANNGSKSEFVNIGDMY